MRKNITIFLIVLLVIVHFPISTLASTEAKEEIKYGQVLGDLMGKFHGYKDFYEGRTNYYLRALPSDNDLIEMYNLGSTTVYSSHRYTFLVDFKTQFRLSYDQSYQFASYNGKILDTDSGIEYGEFFGELLGQTYGRRDYYAAKPNDWKKAIPTEAAIKKEYNLDKETKEYSQAFVYGFRQAFELNYSQSYRDISANIILVTKAHAMEHGAMVGELEGAVFGRLHFVDGRPNDYKRALMSDKAIIDKYNLSKESADYREAFVLAYKEAFIKGYVDTYQSSNIEAAIANINFVELPIKGGQVISGDQKLVLDVEGGTFYTSPIISIENRGIKYDYLDNVYRLASNVYHMKLANLINLLDIDKSMTLSFEFYGDSKAGIYELKNNQWMYIPSIVKDGKISASIKPSSIGIVGGTYAVLLDRNLVEFQDIDNHWAQPEIYTLGRRKYLDRWANTKLLKPDSIITRGEVIGLLDNVYRWDANITSNVEVFVDHMTLGAYKSSMGKAVALGIVKGFPDKTLRSGMSISYQELEIILRRTTNNARLSIQDYLREISLKRDAVPKDKFDLTRPATRAEVIYILHQILNTY